MLSGITSGIRSGIQSGTNPHEAAGDPECTLSVAISDSADPVMTSAAFSYSVVLTVSDEDAVNPEVVVVLDPQLTFVSGSGTGWTVDNVAGTVTCTRAAGSVGALPTITINVTSPATGETSSTTADADADNAAAPATQDTETTLSKLVSKDATSGIRVPASSTEWQNMIDCGAPGAVPDSIWLMQEASGDLADSVGSLTLTAGGTPVYEQAAAGWTRLGVTGEDGTTDQFAAAAASGPNPTTTSQTWLAFAVTPATPAASRTVMGISLSSTTLEHKLQHLITSGLPRLRHVGTSTDGGTSLSSVSTPLAVKYDLTNSEAKGYTKDDKMTATFSLLVADGPKGIGRGTGTIFVYGAMWSGTDGEISDANLKTLLQFMGWSIAWS